MKQSFQSTEIINDGRFIYCHWKPKKPTDKRMEIKAKFSNFSEPLTPPPKGDLRSVIYKALVS